ncbi:glycosyltransferase [Poriferisphaera sp. WC338]|uniref:glycosyltransferase n=1 Tax=Poriferisphaera sp. WC338 TaxID=3425129 RepID=UPI003D814399
MYVPFSDNGGIKSFDVVIVFREVSLLEHAHRTYPDANLYFWLQTIPNKQFQRHRKNLTKFAVQIIGVSDFHRGVLEDKLKLPAPIRWLNRLSTDRPKSVTYMYNAIDEDLNPDPQIKQDIDKLVFFSSPHKGLDEVLKCFHLAREKRSTLKLYLANPGYLNLDVKTSEGIVCLGELAPKDVLRHVREAFCVFYPQTQFEETFGCVFAEANAVGTPVLAHPIGSAAEVLGNQEQLVDARDPKRVVDRLMHWYKNGAPKVKANEAFRLSHVLDGWETLLSTK